MCQCACVCVCFCMACVRVPVRVRVHAHACGRACMCSHASGRARSVHVRVNAYFEFAVKDAVSFLKRTLHYMRMVNLNQDSTSPFVLCDCHTHLYGNTGSAFLMSFAHSLLPVARVHNTRENHKEPRVDLEGNWATHNTQLADVVSPAPS